jgi:hypothetical protein
MRTAPWRHSNPSIKSDSGHYRATAVSPARRKRLTAFTLAADGRRVAHVAARPAQRYSMKCEFVNVLGLAEPAAHRLDVLGHPLAAGVFGWAESQVAQALPGLSGQGADQARAWLGAGVNFERPHATVQPEGRSQ